MGSAVCPSTAEYTKCGKNSCGNSFFFLSSTGTLRLLHMCLTAADFLDSVWSLWFPLERTREKWKALQTRIAKNIAEETTCHFASCKPHRTTPRCGSPFKRSFYGPGEICGLQCENVNSFANGYVDPRTAWAIAHAVRGSTYWCLINAFIASDTRKFGSPQQNQNVIKIAYLSIALLIAVRCDATRLPPNLWFSRYWFRKTEFAVCGAMRLKKRTVQG